MKKGIIGFTLCISFLAFLAACKPEKQPESVPKDDNINPAITEVPEEWIPVEQKEIEDFVVTMDSGVALPGLTRVGEDDKYYCNVDENLQSDSDGFYPVYVCKDPVYDITYFVNYGRDYLIYAVKDGTAEPAVKIPAKDLYCRNGELYFIADTFSMYTFQGFEQGNILKYNPVNGTVSPVINEAALSMQVYPDRINYIKKDTSEIPLEIKEKYHLGDDYTWGNLRISYFFSDGTSEELPYSVLLDRIHGFSAKTIKEVLPETSEYVQRLREAGEFIEGSVITMVTALSFTDESTQLVRELRPYHNIGLRFRVSGDTIFYVNGPKGEDEDVLMSLCLTTGESRVIKKFEHLNGWFSLGDIILFQGVLYGCYLRYSLDTDHLSLIKSRLPGRQTSIENYFTDGEELYGIEDGMLFRLEEREVPEQDQESREINGILFKSEYEFILHDPTKKAGEKDE